MSEAYAKTFDSMRAGGVAISMYVVAVVCTAVVLAMPGLASAALPLTACDQSGGGNLELLADLDCTGHPNPTMDFHLVKTSLNLAGFELKGVQIKCKGKCKILSSPKGGRITDSRGIVHSPQNQVRARVSVRNVTITSALGFPSVVAGIRVSIRKSVLTGMEVVASQTASVSSSTIQEAGGDGVTASFGIKVSRSSILNNERHGISCRSPDRCQVKSSVIEGNTIAGILSGVDLKVANSSVSSNLGDGILTTFSSSARGTLKIKDSAIDANGGNGVRLMGGTLEMTRGSISGNTQHGVLANHTFDLCDLPSGGLARTVTLSGTAVVGNGTGGSCLAGPCADIAVCEPPTIDATTTCDVSYIPHSGNPGMSWGVCTLD